MMIIPVLVTSMFFAASILGDDDDHDNDSNLSSSGHRCGQNEEWTPCGQNCEGKCSQSRYSICPITCRSYGCACKYGYYRNQRGFCVPKCSCFLSEQHYHCNLRCDQEKRCQILKIFCPVGTECHPVPYCVWKDSSKNPGLLGSLNASALDAE